MVSRRKIGSPLLQEPMLKTVDISISHLFTVTFNQEKAIVGAFPKVCLQL